MSPRLLTTILAASAASARAFATTTPDERADALESVAAALDAHADELVPLAQSETHLPEPRLRGELKRTTFAPATTSVGTAAVMRFRRPVAFQNVPAHALPAELRENARGPRLIDGHVTS